MGKFDGVLLVTDFDETLCDDRHVISEADQAAIVSFQRQGGCFTVATGRSRRTFLPYARQLPLTAPVIVANGASIFDFAADETVAETALPSCFRADALELAGRFPTLAFETYDGLTALCCRPNRATLRHAARVNCGFVETTLDRFPDPCLKLILEESEPLLRRVRDYVLSAWPGRYEAFFSAPILLELTDRGCTKASAVLTLARRLGIAPEHIYCAGDHQNDLPMLRAARIGFCPANATPEVRASGARIVGPGGNGCVRDVVAGLDALY